MTDATFNGDYLISLEHIKASLFVFPILLMVTVMLIDRNWNFRFHSPFSQVYIIGILKNIYERIFYCRYIMLLCVYPPKYIGWDWNHECAV